MIRHQFVLHDLVLSRSLAVVAGLRKRKGSVVVVRVTEEQRPYFGDGRHFSCLPAHEGDICLCEDLVLDHVAFLPVLPQVGAIVQFDCRDDDHMTVFRRVRDNEVDRLLADLSPFLRIRLLPFRQVDIHQSIHSDLGMHVACPGQGDFEPGVKLLLDAGQEWPGQIRGPVSRNLGFFGFALCLLFRGHQQRSEQLRKHRLHSDPVQVANP